MWITGISAEGLPAVQELELGTLRRAMWVDSPPETCEQLAAALQLGFAALLPERLPRVLAELAFHSDAESIEILGQPLPDQARWQSPHAARALLQGNSERTIKIGIQLQLDPLQFRFLREHAARHPWLVTALSEGARAELTLGYLFDRSLTAASVSILSVVLGEERVPVAGKESPRWLPEFLAGLARRFRCLPVAGGSASQAAAAWLAAMEHPDPSRRAAFERVRACLQAAPFGIDSPRPVRWGDQAQVVAGPQGKPLAWLGPAAVEALELAAAVHLSGAEILTLRYPGRQQPEPALALRWLADQATEPGSPLEQVLLLGVSHLGGEPGPEPPVDES